MWPFGWRKRIEEKLDYAIALLEQSLNKEKLMSQQLDDLTAQVASQITVESSAVTLIQGMAAQLAAAGTDPVKLQALHDQLKASADALAAAVVANTQTPPAPPVAPPATPAAG